MIKYLLVILLSLIASYVQAQFQYALYSVPDSALVRVNGKDTCQTPCQLTFRWRDLKDHLTTIQVVASGFETWTDTIRTKPASLEIVHQINLKSLKLERMIDPAVHSVKFDRLLGEFEDGTVIGAIVHRRGDMDTLKWEGRTKVGNEAFGETFRTMLSMVGIEAPGLGPTPLFSDQLQKVKQARFTVAARLDAYEIDLREDSVHIHGLEPMVGSTRMRISWQVKDALKDAIVLERTTDGVAQYRQKSKEATPDNRLAFEEALRAFLLEGSFVDLVKEAGEYDPSRAQPLVDAGSLKISSPTLPDFRSLSEMVLHADKACVTIVTENGHGSGVIIDSEGYVLSAYHVVEGATGIEVQFSDGLRQKATILAHDVRNDVVLLDIAGSGFRALPIGSSESLALGSEVVTIGTPADITLGQSVARGILSGKRKFDDATFLQTDMAVSPGNSGGPLLNSKGEVIGIIQRKIVGSGIEGLGFALPIERGMEVLGIRGSAEEKH